MKRRWIGTGIGLAFLLAASAAAGADLALKRVMLSSGGVAYVEYEAAIDGNAELALDVPLDQVDDVLKSIVVFDDRGGIGSASLPGREPLAQSFRDLPFDQQALSSPADLLNALQGAEIKVGGNRPLAGKLLRVAAETVMVGPQQTTTHHRVSVLTSAGLQQFVLEDADSVAFADPGLQAKVDKALSEIADNRSKDRRRLVLSARGEGRRTLRVGYVVGAPLWKASFRMVLPADPKAETAHLQGWAVLENMSGQDWQNVELTLLSGNPVSFRQAIYDTYYITRPEVPVDVVGHILPKRDTGEAEPVPVAVFKSMGGMLANPGVSRSNLLQAPAPPPMAEAKPQLAESVDTAEASEAATQVAFRVPVPVTVESGHSAMIPIIDREVPAERVALYQPATLATHPLASLRLKNDQASGLPPGIVTLYERAADATSYVGDAQLAALPAGETRLISYAADEKTQIFVTADSTDAITHASIGDGLLKFTRLFRRTTTYHVKAPAAEPRLVLIEQPKMSGWNLAAPVEQAAEQTPALYRFPLALEPGKSVDLIVSLEHPGEQTERILDFNDDRIGALVQDRQLDPKIRSAFAELARLRAAATAKKAAADDLDRQIATIGSEQQRIRLDLASADRDSDLHKRYMTKLAEQETQIETLQAARAKAEIDQQITERAVSEYLRKLDL
jgi:hypothetical protein